MNFLTRGSALSKSRLPGFSVLITAMVLFAGCSNYKPLSTISNVDLKKYSGKWYEIASFPQRFQKDCNCTTAEYTPTNDGYIIVTNRCKKKSPNGTEVSVTGKAFVDDTISKSKLMIQFFWPFRGKYWIIDLAPDYSYSVVGHPNRGYLWILSRTPTMRTTLYDSILTKVAADGFDISKSLVTNQSCY